MKKILSLVIALVLAMTVFSVLAEGSKTGEDIATATVTYTDEEGQTTETGLELDLVEDTEDSSEVIESFQEAYKAGDVLSALPEEVRSKIPEDRTNINEMMTFQFIGETDEIEGDLKINLQLDTPYEKDEQVSVLFGKLTDPVEWTIYEGIGLEDGSIEFYVPASDVKELKNNPFVLAVVSA